MKQVYIAPTTAPWEQPTEFITAPSMESIAATRAAIESEDVTEFLAKINQENGDEH